MSCPDPQRALAAPFQHTVTGIGRFLIQPLRREDIPLIHAWVTAPRASFWGMQGQTLEQVAAVYHAQIDSPHQAPCLAYCNGEPAFLLESYDPAHDELATHYQVLPGDRGMHFLVAPAPGKPVHGFTRAVMDSILAWLFSDPLTTRIVVEPDVCNEKIHPLNRAAGFEYLRTLELSYKTAWFAVCTRQAYLRHALPQTLPQPCTETFA
ncbi:GNAT family N-acetyltransferase [Chitinilyticum litopenaei]|uniref:GNAT family N-acetyltransferase n=1 Tax=Chitinilyticum litopenaei TaxID=1121276 RepID=UPI00041EA565|nr:GNAT family N-acetyltransferase [Chitinilyticum litopenaei]